MRKMVPLYLLGFRSAGPLRQRLLEAGSLEEWTAAIRADAPDFDASEPFPAEFARFPRYKGQRMQRQSVSLPPGWLDDRWADEVPMDGLDDSACEG